MDKPHYPFKSIGSISSLSTTLGVPTKLLEDLAGDIESNYTEFIVASKSGKNRDVFEPKYNLKRLQKRIITRILSKVEYPFYLQGGLRDESQPRDYVSNANIHAKAETLISLDISSFYQSITSAWVHKIFKFFFKFPDDVSCILTTLTTKNGTLPQGACTSSYLANLIFYDSEYKIVSKLRRKNISYSRLLDDVTISSNTKMNENNIDNCITEVIDMFSSRGLKSNNSKKKVEHRNFRFNEYKVTGLWVGHSIPKMRKSERRYIRQLVFECEKLYAIDKCTDDYHKLWNSTSGKVSKMAHLAHAQSEEYRERLRKILPELSNDDVLKLTFNVKRFVSKVSKRKYKTNVGVTNRFNQLLYKIGICGRSDSEISKSLRTQMKQVRDNVQSKAELWG